MLARTGTIFCVSVACSLTSSLALAWNELDYQDLYYSYPKNIEQVHWIGGTPLVLPSGALTRPADRQKPTYICKAMYREGIYAGYVRDEGCSIGVYGRQMIVPEFLMPTTAWPTKFVRPEAIKSNDQILAGATFQDRTSSPMRRVYENGQYYPGYFQNGYCHIGQQGNEIWRPHFSVLVAP